MRSDFGESQVSPVEMGRSRGESDGYEAPTIVVLGTFAELTQQGQAPTDELFNDGSQV
jgi:hypothetical protein